MKYLYVLAFLACAVALAESLSCAANFCADKKCEYVSRLGCVCRGGIYEARGTFCGCCPACLDKIHKGEDCGFLLIEIGFPPTAACESGTSCQTLNNGTSFECL